jgi:FtsH-binding integral membrane protein
MTQIDRGRLWMLSVFGVSVAFAVCWLWLFSSRGMLWGRSLPSDLRPLWICSQLTFAFTPAIMSLMLRIRPSSGTIRFVGIDFAFGCLVAITVAVFARRGLLYFGAVAIAFAYCSAVVLTSKDLWGYLGQRATRDRL